MNTAPSSLSLIEQQQQQQQQHNTPQTHGLPYTRHFVFSSLLNAEDAEDAGEGEDEGEDGKDTMQQARGMAACVVACPVPTRWLTRERSMDLMLPMGVRIWPALSKSTSLRLRFTPPPARLCPSPERINTEKPRGPPPPPRDEGRLHGAPRPPPLQVQVAQNQSLITHNQSLITHKHYSNHRQS